MATGEIIGSINLGGDPSKGDGKYYIPPTPANTTRASPLGGCCTMGGGARAERDRDLDVEGSIRIRFGQQYSSMRPDPHGLLRSIVGNKHPMVIDPAGEILVPSHTGEFGYQFTDEIARIWASQNDGIYIPSGFGGEDKRLKFKDLLTALERIKPNYQNRDGSYDYAFQKTMHELAMQENAFADLAQETQHLDDVWGFVSRISCLEKAICGIEGDVHKRDGTEHDTSYRCGDSWFGIRLGLDLRGFGGEHLKVSGRTLRSAVGEYQGIGRGSHEERAINWLVSEFQPENVPYKLRAEFVEKEGNRDKYDKVFIIMNSPDTYWSDNTKLEKPVMQTSEMLPIFVPVVSAVVEGLERLKNHRKAQSEEQFREVYDVMRKPQTVVKGFGEKHQ